MGRCMNDTKQFLNYWITYKSQRWFLFSRIYTAVREASCLINIVAYFVTACTSVHGTWTFSHREPNYYPLDTNPCSDTRKQFNNRWNRHVCQDTEDDSWNRLLWLHQRLSKARASQGSECAARYRQLAAQEAKPARYEGPLAPHLALGCACCCYCCCLQFGRLRTRRSVTGDQRGRHRRSGVKTPRDRSVCCCYSLWRYVAWRALAQYTTRSTVLTTWTII